ncbi:hypothetical protein GH714_006300 [Hevea brasiliensis]|uniref:GTD-binding domain-containing protein n=1 Tax=Hevea brasiliensis TaxID=3981 RepID=A0A6A6KA17_HEVBR|nr:hypothetical protein GH714_006300 [Hevea brasiliensis]
MPCHAIRGWTFSGLVGAFLGLSITFLLLCASTLAYLASKFLGLFGLDLPCPCNSFFGVPDNANNTGLQRRLVDYPLPKISSVQSSAKSKFPFGTIRNDLQLNSNKENDGNGDKHEGIGLEGEVSCISSSERRTDNFTGEDLAKMKGKSFVMGTLNLPDVKEGRYELKRKKNASTAEEFNSHGNQVSDCNAKNTVRLLEQALEEEHAARAVLYIELEKERSAAASAADEAMAMILRLQEEKASIEMEARQCQRIIEEKYAYDAEEMNILKEILVRREREKHYLEKEVEAYRQKISGNEQLYAEMYGMSATKGEITLYTSDEDSVLKLPQSSDYIGEEEKAENKAIDDKESEGDIHDVHVVDDQASVYKQVMRDKNRQLSTNAAATSKNPNISMGLPPTGSSRSRSLRYDMRRKSMSAFDVESALDCPSEKISSVQFSVKGKFPFDSIWDKNLKQKICEDKFFGLDDEASCSSLHEMSEVGIGCGVMYARDVKKERSDTKGKGVLNQKVRHALRRRRKGATDNGTSPSVSTYDTFQWDAQSLCPSPASVSKMVNEGNEDSMVPDSSGGLALNYGGESTMGMGFRGKAA